MKILRLPKTVILLAALAVGGPMVFTVASGYPAKNPSATSSSRGATVGAATQGSKGKVETVNTRGPCATEEEFKAVITHDKTFLAGAYSKMEVIFHSFKVGARQSYVNIDGPTRYHTVTDSAYPVTTSFDVITRKDGKVYRSRYENAQYMFYTSAWSDGLNCVCFGVKNATAKSEDEVTAAGN